MHGIVGAADPATHKIYIWDLSNDGQLSNALEGGREPLVHVHVSDWYSGLSTHDIITPTLTVAPAQIFACIDHESG
jgi:hypothetical protein